MCDSAVLYDWYVRGIQARLLNIQSALYVKWIQARLYNIQSVLYWISKGSRLDGIIFSLCCTGCQRDPG